MILLNRLHKSYEILAEVASRPWVHFAALTIYYSGILLGLVVLYGKGDFSTPPFIYQNF